MVLSGKKNDLHQRKQVVSTSHVACRDALGFQLTASTVGLNKHLPSPISSINLKI